MDAQAHTAFIDERVKHAVATSQAALLDKLDGLISSKLTDFEQRMGQTQRQISDSQITKIEQNIRTNEVIDLNERDVRINSNSMRRSPIISRRPRQT